LLIFIFLNSRNSLKSKGNTSTTISLPVKNAFLSFKIELLEAETNIFAF